MTAETKAEDAVEVTEVPLGARGSAKLRKPFRTGLFDLLTLGVYGVVWYYKVNRELALLGRSHNTTELGENPTNSLLALFPGFLILVPAAISIFNTVKRLRAARDLMGISDAEGLNVPLAVVLLFVLPPIGSPYFQKRLNGVWHAVQTSVRVELPEPA